MLRLSTGDFYEGDAQAAKLFTNKRFHLASAMHACSQPTPGKGARDSVRLLAPKKPSREAIEAAESRRKEFLCWGFLAFTSNTRKKHASPQDSKPLDDRILLPSESGGVKTSERALNQHLLLVQQQTVEFLASQADFLEECVLLHQRHHALVLSQLAQGLPSSLPHSSLPHPSQDEEVEEDDENEEDDDEEEVMQNWSLNEGKEVQRAGSKDDGADMQRIKDSGPRLWRTHEDKRQFSGQVADTVAVSKWGRSYLDRGVPRNVSGTRQAAGKSSTEEPMSAAATEGRTKAGHVVRSQGDMPNTRDTQQALDADEVADMSDTSHVRLMVAVGSAGQARRQAHLRWAEAQSRADEAATLLLRPSAAGGKQQVADSKADELRQDTDGLPRDAHALSHALPPDTGPKQGSGTGKQGRGTRDAGEDAGDTGKRHSTPSQYSASKMVRVLDKDGYRCAVLVCQHALHACVQTCVHALHACVQTLVTVCRGCS